MLLVDFIRQGTESLESLYPAAEARKIILMLCEHRLGTKSYTHIVEPKRTVPAEKEKGLSESLERLLKGEPIQYVTGTATFCGYEFTVTPDVLIPRPETEILCKEAVKTGDRMRRMRNAYGKNASPVRVLDLCTGSGCIAWTVAQQIEGAKVTAVDISEAALEVAKKQKFPASVNFILHDVLGTENIPDIGPFDIILSNPPYVRESEKSAMRTNVLDYEPSLALFVSDSDPLVFYYAIAEWSRRLLAPDGVCITEINEALGPDTQEVFKKAGFGSVELIHDLFDKNRFVLYKK